MFKSVMRPLDFSKKRKKDTEKVVLDFFEKSTLLKYFGRDVLTDKNKIAIISALLYKFLDLHDEIEKSNGKVLHEVEFVRELKCVLKQIYFCFSRSMKAQYNGISYEEITFSRNGKDNLLKVNDPTIFLKA
jgi:hypothetical protein